MAESLPFGISIDKSSENLHEHYCEPCYQLKDEVKPVVGHCIDCNENFCVECFNYHLGPKPFRNHKLVDKSVKPQQKPKPKTSIPRAGETCLVHSGTIIQSFCTSHSQLCCKVFRTIKHKTCDVIEISKMARNIHDSQEFQSLNKKLNDLKNRFEESWRKTGKNEIIIQKSFSDAINDIKKLRDEIDKLLNQTEKLALEVKEEDFKNIETVSSTCDIVIEQINTITSNLVTLKEKKEKERLFIFMQNAESQLQSLEESLETLDNDNSVREYKFAPDEKLEALVKVFKGLGKLTFTDQQAKTTYIQEQMTKKPVYVKSINTKSAYENSSIMYGSLALTNNQILVTDSYNKTIKQFDYIQGRLISELQLSGSPFDITKVNSDKVAVTVIAPNTIQILSLFKQSLQKVKQEIPVNGQCHGIAYNDKDQTFVVTFTGPAKVEIMNMTGTVLKTLGLDSDGRPLFSYPYHLALSPDMKGMYITDVGNQSVALLTFNGDIKAVYNDSKLQYPAGIYAHSSGLVYVVGHSSQTVHYIDPVSDKFKLLLEKKDGLEQPWGISYCEVDNKLYVGMQNSRYMKVYEME